MKLNTIEQLNKFKKGDVVNIHNKITGELSYSGVIISISEYAYIKDGIPSRSATIMTDKGQHSNFLGTAKKVN